MEWISVDDELPELEYHGFFRCLVAFKEGGVSHSIYNTRIEKFIRNDYTTISEYTVTHWMPLHDPPQQTLG